MPVYHLPPTKRSGLLDHYAKNPPDPDPSDISGSEVERLHIEIGLLAERVAVLKEARRHAEWDSFNDRVRNPRPNKGKP